MQCWVRIITKKKKIKIINMLNTINSKYTKIYKYDPLPTYFYEL